MKKFFNEFKEFISRGSVIDMAIGIIIGAAFTSIVNSMVKDIINPLIGFVVGGLDLSNLTLTLRAATESRPALTMNYGLFISNVINFLVVAFVLFMFMRLINNARRKVAEKLRKANGKKSEESKPEPEAENTVLLKEIRDLLKRK